MRIHENAGLLPVRAWPTCVRGRFGAQASSTTVVLASSTCSQDDQLLVIERPGGTDMNCDLLSGIRADVDVLDARLAEIRSAHVSGASGPDAQE